MGELEGCILFTALIIYVCYLIITSIADAIGPFPEVSNNTNATQPNLTLPLT